MTQQTINIGTGELTGDGESLRSAFTKINSNFTELYTSGGGSLTSVSSHILPSANSTYDLGSTSSQWRSLYVSTNTVYIGGNALSVVNGSLSLNGNPAASLGQFKIYSSAGGSTLGTVDNPNTGGWGGYDIYIDSGGNLGSNAKIYIPSVANQAAGTSLQIVNNGTATSIIQLFGRGGIQLVTNTGVNEKIFEFADNGDLIIPNAILGSGDQAVVIQNTASGVAYLQLPVDPSADSVFLANQAASSATVTIRVGDFGSEKDWTFNEFGALAVPPGGIYNNDTSNVGQLLLAGDVGEAATYLALPSDVGSTSMNVRLVNTFGDIQLVAGNNKNWYFNNNGTLQLPAGGDIVDSTGNTVLNPAPYLTSATISNGTLTFYLSDSSNITVQGSISSPPSFSFTSISTTTEVIANNTTVNAIIGPANVGKAWVVYKVYSSVPSWFRMYATTASMIADMARESSVDPAANVEILLETISTTTGTVVLLPPLNGFNNDPGGPFNRISCNITNISGTSTAITITATIVNLVI